MNTAVNSKLHVIVPNTKRLQYVQFAIYQADQTLAIGLYDVETDERYCVATVCLPEARSQRTPNSVWLKGWSENEGIPKALEAAGVITLTGIKVPTGHVFAELGKLTDVALAEMMRQREAFPERFGLAPFVGDIEAKAEAQNFGLVPNDPRVTATVLAALRYWQRTVITPSDGLIPDEESVLFDDGSRDGIQPLDEDAIDELCERINCGEVWL